MLFNKTPSHNDAIITTFKSGAYHMPFILIVWLQIVDFLPTNFKQCGNEKLIYTALLIISALSMNACHVYLAPTTYRCMDIDALYEFREKPIGEPGMTTEQFRQAYEQSKLSLSYDNSEDSLVYLKHNSCSIWRYRFDKGRLVARGYLVQEMGFWSYSETNFEETRVTEDAILDDEFNLIGVRIRTKKPIYNSQGELTAVKETWIDKMNKN